jgi:hypothetical protein
VDRVLNSVLGAEIEFEIRSQFFFFLHLSVFENSINLGLSLRLSSRCLDRI